MCWGQIKHTNRKYVISRLASIDNEMNFRFGNDVTDRIDELWSFVSRRDVRNENSVVNVDQHQSQQTPGPDDDPDGRNLARNVTTCYKNV
jgi:hypothetical protein